MAQAESDWTDPPLADFPNTSTRHEEKMKTHLTYAALTAANLARCQMWHPGFPERNAGGWTGGDWSNAMCGEAGEAANVVKKLRRFETGRVGAVDAPPDELLAKLGEELADTIIYADLLATYYGIDLGAAVIRKFNSISVREGFPHRLEAGS